MYRYRKAFAMLMILVMTLGLISCGAPGNKGSGRRIAGDQADSISFGEFIEAQFVNTMESDYTTMHTYLRDPGAYGVDPGNVTVELGSRYDEETMDANREALKDLYEQFALFDRSQLSTRQQEIYDAFAHQLSLEMQLSQKKYDYYSQLFSPVSGLDTILVSLLSSWDLYNEKDVRDLITVVNDIRPYVASALDYTRKQQTLELLITDFDKIIKNCEDVLATGTDSFILDMLDGQIDALGLDPAAAEGYKEELRDAFSSSFLGAYQDIREAMEGMRNGWVCNGSIADLPEGRRYFELLMQYTCGTDMTADEVYAFLDECATEHYSNMLMLNARDSAAVSDYYNGNAGTTGYDDYHDILDFIAKRLTADFPEVPDLKYQIRDADPEERLGDIGVLAYYIIPPIDGGNIQRMVVDPENNDVSSLESYGTISHEGFPGHMYQYAYMYANNDSPYMMTLGIDGYIEGYAMYAEYKSFDYLDGIDSTIRDIHTESEASAYATYAISDIGVNYRGWDLQEMLGYFNDEGYNLDESGAKELYDHFRFDPAGYIPYSFGYEKFAQLRSDAEKALGDDFVLRDFNKAILDAAPAPFCVVEEHVKAYIDSIA